VIILLVSFVSFKIVVGVFKYEGEGSIPLIYFSQ